MSISKNLRRRISKNMLQLGVAIINIVSDDTIRQKQCKPQEEPPGKPPREGNEANDPMLLTVSIGRKPAIIKMETMGRQLTNNIVDKGSGVNIPPKYTWKSLVRQTLWSSTFYLVGVDKHGIKPLVILMAQQAMIGTQQFILDSIVIPLQKRVYDALLGRDWLITAKASHNWKCSTLSIESEGRKYIIDLRNQAVSEELASSNSKFEDGDPNPKMDEGK